jgi:hypothetical protein
LKIDISREKMKEMRGKDFERAEKIETDGAMKKQEWREICEAIE